MAKKNLHGLMNGILGSDASNEPVAAPDAESPVTEETTSTKSKKGGDKATRATFLVPSETLRKIKYIALIDDRLQLDIVGEALSEYVQRWENENGVINFQKK